MATMTWRGGSGDWSVSTDWSLLRTPLATDSLILGSASPYVVRLTGRGMALDIAAASGAILDVAGALTLGGTLALAAGAGLELSGSVLGGTLNLRQGSVSGAGTLDGVTIMGGLGVLTNASIDAGTAADTAGVNAGTLAANGVLTLAAGTYDSLVFLLNPALYGTSELAVAAGTTVNIGAHATIDLFQDSAVYSNPIAEIAAGLIGGGTFVNAGTLVSNVSNQAGGDLQIGTRSFVNIGQLSFVPMLTAQSGSFVVGVHLVHGTPEPIYGLLSWTEAFAETLDVSSASFRNTGTVLISGGTLDFTGGPTLSNSGVIALADATGQTVVLGKERVTSVQAVTLSTSVEIEASVTDFTNTGTISADRIQFDGAVSLAGLGALHGAVSFIGTLDLDGGTLDAGKYGSVAISGTVLNGTLIAGTGTLSLSGATLDNAAVAGAGTLLETGPILLVDAPAGAAVTLDANITKLELTSASINTAHVTAGALSVTDTVALMTPGTVTLGADFELLAEVAGSTVEIAGAAGGAADVVANGLFVVDAATLLVAATLDGSGSLLLADGATATLEAVAATADDTVTFGPGASRLVISGSGTLGLTLATLQKGDVIDLASVSSRGDGTAHARVEHNVLTVTGASGQTAMLALAGTGPGPYFTEAPDGTGGTLLQVACFLSGTRIATAAGEAPVETLRPGDTIRCASGRLAPVRWVGRTLVDLASQRNPERATPIRIAAHAFAEGQPRRDLLVSREHCLLVDGALVPAERLTNGATIARDDRFARVEYWHVELDHHDILLAEGLAAESYLDTGNRGLFAGAGGARPLHPDPGFVAEADALAVWAARGCAPLRLDAPDSRAKLLARAERLGWSRTGEPAAEVLVAGCAVPVVAIHGGLSALLPAGTARVDLRSRSIVPLETIFGSGDTRRLGLALRGLRLCGRDLPEAAYLSGWHADTGEGWRWTDGAATVKVPFLTRSASLTLELASAARYWQHGGR